MAGEKKKPAGDGINKAVRDFDAAALLGDVISDIV